MASITGLVLFFQRKQVFPRFMIVLISCLAGFTVIDGLAGAMLPGEDATANIEAGGEAFLMVVYAAIWIPYFCMSRRMRTTFVL